MKDIYADDAILFEINFAELKEEAKNRLGRNLQDNEIDMAIKLLEISTNDARNMIFYSVFENLKLK